jgi:hypothetical protein
MIEKPKHNTLFVRPNSGKPGLLVFVFFSCGAIRLDYFKRLNKIL